MTVVSSNAINIDLVGDLIKVHGERNPSKPAMIFGDIVTTYAELEKKEAESDAPLSFKELFEILDDFKKRDYAVYKKYRADKRALHRMDPREKHRARRNMVRPKFHLKFRK